LRRDPEPARLTVIVERVTMSTTEPAIPPGPHPGVADPAGSPAHRYGDTPVARTWWDVVTGGILLGTGVVVLADVAVASVISVLFLGWTLIIGGALSIAASLVLIRRGGFWIGMLGGTLALVAGLVLIRNPGVTLLAISLAIGALMLVNGVFHLVAAVQQRQGRAAMVFSGVLSLLLGLLVFTRWPSSALWLIGTLLGVQLLIEGMTLIIVGRPRPAA
jgi:uncharacterized membrane protein HdeD (DUF308 family)